MKTGKRIIALALLVVTLVSVMSFAASASSTDISFQGTTYMTNHFRTPLGKKDNNTASYLYITDASELYTFVREIACQSNGTGNLICTYSDGSPTMDVVCRRGVKYNIYNDVYELGYRYAKLSFMPMYENSSDVKGKWSADSVGTYNPAT